MQEIDVADLEARRKAQSPHVLLDVREASEVAIAAVAGARHMPMNDVPARIGEVPPDVPIIVMCHHGGRSARVVELLNREGRMNAVNLRGGIDAWSVEIDPTVPRY